MKWKCLGATKAQQQNGRPHNLTEWDRIVLMRIGFKNSLSSVKTLTAEFQTASGSNVSTRTVRRELHEMGFHGRAAAYKPKITMRDAKHRLEWCKVCRHWTGAVEMHSLEFIYLLFISPLFNQVGQLRTSSHLQLRPGQDKSKQ